jgi:hypothetical protein
MVRAPFYHLHQRTFPLEGATCPPDGRISIISALRSLVFSRTGDPATGEFSDATVIRKFGDVPDDLSARAQTYPR